MKYAIVSAAVAAAAIFTSAAGYAQEDQGPRFTATLDGASEVPGPGDADGAGTATVRINTKRGQLCYTLTVTGIAPATMAHIHEAPAGTSGPVILGLTAPAGGTSQGCLAISRDQAAEIIADPSDYYVNVHNPDFPGGAVRGQLTRISN